MNDRCYDLCSGIHSKLVSAGWKQVFNDTDDYRYYEQTKLVNYEYDIRAVVQNSSEGIYAGGDIGIAWLEIRYTNDHLNDVYLSPCDFKFMNEAMAAVEKNLLRLKIPFSVDYDFQHDYLIPFNMKLRDELHVDDILDEFYKEAKPNE